MVLNIFLTIWEAINNFFDNFFGIDDFIADGIEYFYSLDAFFRFLILLFLAVIIILGVISFIKKIFKVFIIIVIIFGLYLFFK